MKTLIKAVGCLGTCLCLAVMTTVGGCTPENISGPEVVVNDGDGHNQAVNDGDGHNQAVNDGDGHNQAVNDGDGHNQ